MSCMSRSEKAITVILALAAGLILGIAGGVDNEPAPTHSTVAAPRLLPGGDHR